MSKLSRKLQKIFGFTAGGTEIGVFGSKAAGSPAYSTDPDDIQSLSQYLDGWYEAVIGGNSPCIEDMNALFYLYAYQLAYIFQSGVPEWDVDTVYYIGSFCSDSTGKIYYSLVDDNTGNALSDTTKWRLYGSSGAVQTKSADYQILAGDSILRMSGTHTGTLPDATLVTGNEYIVKNVGSGVVTVATLSAQTIDGQSTYSLAEPLQFVRVKSNGTNWDIVGW